MLRSILHTTYSSEAVMRLDIQILLKSTPLNLLAGSALGRDILHINTKQLCRKDIKNCQDRITWHKIWNTWKAMLDLLFISSETTTAPHEVFCLKIEKCVLQWRKSKNTFRMRNIRWFNISFTALCVLFNEIMDDMILTTKCYLTFSSRTHV